MGYERDDKHMIKLQTFVGKTQYEQLKFRSEVSKLPMSRLIAIAIDYELQKEKPFEWDMKIPGGEYLEFTYADEAGKIVNYMRTLGSKGMSLDLLLLLRADMGIKDKNTFMQGFRECLEKKVVEPYVTNDLKYKTDTIFYRVAGLSPLETKKVSKEVREYKAYLRLQKKYGKK